MTGTWVETRRPAPPAGVIEHLRPLLPGPSAQGQPTPNDLRYPEVLAAAALELLARVTTQSLGGGRGGRELARDLLAADALVTYAFEAQAEQNVDGLGQLADFVARERRQDSV